MSNGWEQAQEYVKRMRQQGHREADIRTALRQSGWEEQQIESLIGSPKLTASTPPLVAIPPSVQPYPPAVQPPAPGATYVEYAGFWRRFLAAFIDGIILNLVSGVMGIAAGLVLGLSVAAAGRDVEGATEAIQVVSGMLGLVLSWLYYALMESSATQATLGKMAIGMVVTDLEGNRIGFGRATGRYFAKIISALILLIGYLMAGFTEKKQGLHDMIAGTLVVMKPRY